jgi:hypothetical protein
MPIESPDGICSDRPRARKSGRRGVFGSLDGSSVWSSFDRRSLILGDGDSFGVESERDLALEGLLEGVRIAASFGVESSPIAASLVSKCRSDAVYSEKDLESMLARTERASPDPNAVGAAFLCMDPSIILLYRCRKSLNRVGIGHCALIVVVESVDLDLMVYSSALELL